MSIQPSFMKNEMKSCVLIYLLLFCYVYPAFSKDEIKKNHWKLLGTEIDTFEVKLENAFIQDRDLKDISSEIRKMYEIAYRNRQKPEYLVRAIFWDSRLQKKVGKTDSALVLLDNALLITDTLRHRDDYIRLRNEKIRLSYYKGNFIDYYKEFVKHAEYFRNKKDTLMYAVNCVDIGNILYTLQEFEKALFYLNKADSLYRIQDLITYRTKNQLNISNVLYKTGEKEQAIQVLKGLLKDEVSANDTLFRINVLLSLSIYDKEGLEKYISEAYYLSSVTNEKRLLVKATLNKAALFSSMNKPDSALFYYNSLKEYFKEDEDLGMYIYYLGGKVNSFSQKQQYDSAFFYLEEYVYYKDSLEHLNNLFELERIENLAALEKYESDLQQARQEARFQKITTFLVTFMVFIVAVFICVVFWIQRKKALFKRQLKETENKELGMRLENESLQNEHYQLKIESQNRELTSNTLMIIEKKQVLKELLNRIENYNTQGEIPAKISLDFKSLIRGHLGKENEWEYFRSHFEKVHPGFFTNLKQKYSLLSEGELRICAYIRTGMENKQIAQMLSVQSGSIKISRYRIRKKLGLQHEESLEDVLRDV